MKARKINLYCVIGEELGTDIYVASKNQAEAVEIVDAFNEIDLAKEKLSVRYINEVLIGTSK